MLTCGPVGRRKRVRPRIVPTVGIEVTDTFPAKKVLDRLLAWYSLTYAVPLVLVSRRFRLIRFLSRVCSIVSRRGDETRDRLNCFPSVRMCHCYVTNDAIEKIQTVESVFHEILQI
jgi:hypothetical protein